MPTSKQQAEMTKFQAWIKAMRFRSLPLSLSGLVLGAALASHQGSFSLAVCLFSICTGVLLQILSDFANDFGDDVRGTDDETRLGPRRALATKVLTPKEMMFGIKLVVLLIIVFGLSMLYFAFGDDFGRSIFFFFLGAAAVYAAIKYTMGKNPYGYKAQGDYYVFIFFGLVAVIGSYYLYTKDLDFFPIIPAICAGLLSTAVLNINNTRDMKGDELHGKMTIALKLGEKKARIYQLVLVFTSLILWASFLLIYFPIYSLCILIIYVLLIKSAMTVYLSRDHNLIDKQLKVTALSTSLLHIVLSIYFIIQ